MAELRNTVKIISLRPSVLLVECFKILVDKAEELQ